MEYMGFVTYLRWSDDDNIFYGKIENIDDLVLFHGKDISEFRSSFVDSVNDYIIFCKEVEKEIELR